MQAAGRQGKAWEMHDIMFQNMRALKEDNLMAYAEQIGLDVDRFRSDFNSEAVKSEVSKDTKGGAAAGVRGTPTITINGTKYRGPRSLAGFKPVIDAELEKANALIKKGTPIEKIYETLAKR